LIDRSIQKIVGLIFCVKFLLENQLKLDQRIAK